METTRQRSRRMCLILLFICGPLSAALAEDITGLQCTNDYEKEMFCYFTAQNCSEYNLTRTQTSVEHEEARCIFQECETGQCCCSVPVMPVAEETHNVTVWKDDKCVESKHINIKSTIKPKTPTITSLNESNGNIQLRWKTNIQGYLSEELTASVTYYKKGDTKKVSEHVKPSTIDGVNFYEIAGKNLEPRTTYVVNVKSYIEWSEKFSDSSKEWEFTTASSHHILSLGVITSLGIAAVIITSAASGCYYKVKDKWPIVHPSPKCLDIHPGKLKPLENNFSSVSIDPAVLADSKPRSEAYLQKCSGISPDSSPLKCSNIYPAAITAGVQDDLSKVFTHLKPLTGSKSNKDRDLFSTLYNHNDDLLSRLGCTDCENMTYFIPSSAHHIITDSTDVQSESPDKQ